MSAWCYQPSSLLGITHSLTVWSRVLFEKLNSHSTGQEIPRLTWNPSIHYHVHKRPSWRKNTYSII